MSYSKRHRDSELRIMFLSFIGGYMLAKTGIMDDPEIVKKVMHEILDDYRRDKSHQDEPERTKNSQG